MRSRKFYRGLVEALRDREKREWRSRGYDVTSNTMNVGGTLFKVKIEAESKWQSYLFGVSVDILQVDSEEAEYLFGIYHPAPWSWEAKLFRELTQKARDLQKKAREGEEENILAAAREKEANLHLVAGDKE